MPFAKVPDIARFFETGWRLKKVDRFTTVFFLSFFYGQRMSADKHKIFQLVCGFLVFYYSNRNFGCRMLCSMQYYAACSFSIYEY